MLELWLGTPGQPLITGQESACEVNDQSLELWLPIPDQESECEANDQSDIELWLPITGRPGYEISGQGNVRSIRKFHAIRAAFAKGVSVEAIAKECEIYLPTVRKIVSRELPEKEKDNAM